MKLKVHIPGPPQPKERARRGRGGRWYTPNRTRRYERHVRRCMATAVLQERGWPMDAEYAVEARVYFPDRRRRDADNVLKALLDGCNGAAWNDDHQVKRKAIEVAVDRDDPRVEMTVEVVR